MRRRLIFSTLLILIPGLAQSQAPPNQAPTKLQSQVTTPGKLGSERIAIRAGKLIDGKSDAPIMNALIVICLLYTSDAADE